MTTEEDIGSSSLNVLSLFVFIFIENSLLFLVPEELQRITRNFDYGNVERTPENKKFIVGIYKCSNLSLRAFCETHNLRKSTLNDWVQKWEILQKGGPDNFYEGTGRPPILDYDGYNDVRADVIMLCNGQKAPKPRDVRMLVSRHGVKTKERRNIGAVERSVSRTTILNIKRAIDLGEKHGQFKTHARVVAENDPRNAYSMTVMAHAFSEQLDPQMIFNWDATQFIISAEGTNVMVYVKDEIDCPLTSESNGTLDFGIKMYHFHCAAGIPSPPVFVIANSALPADHYVSFVVKGMGNTMDAMNFGYLVFTRTRCCNVEFYSWFATTVVIPFVKMLRDQYDCKVILCIIILESSILFRFNPYELVYIES